MNKNKRNKIVLGLLIFVILIYCFYNLVLLKTEGSGDDFPFIENIETNMGE